MGFQSITSLLGQQAAAMQLWWVHLLCVYWSLTAYLQVLTTLWLGHL